MLKKLSTLSKSNKRILLVGVLILSIVSIYFIGSFVGTWMIIADGGGGSGSITFYESNPAKPTLNPFDPDPDPDSSVTLTWSGTLRTWYYNIYRRYGSAGPVVQIKIASTSLSFTDSREKESGIYFYQIESVNNYGKVRSDWVSVDIDIQPLPPLPGPTNPSILINDGALTTDSYDVVLTISCDNANELKIRLTVDIWLQWEPYKTTYNLRLSETDPYKPDYRISVIFRNANGETTEVYDDITYVEPETPITPEPEPEPTTSTSIPPISTNTIVIIAVVSIAGILGAVYGLRRRKLMGK